MRISDWSSDVCSSDLLALDQPAVLLLGLRRAVAVVERDEVDLAAVDPAAVVDLVEVGRDRLADLAVGGGRSAVRHGVADLDLGIGGARIVFAGGDGGGRKRQAGGGEQCDGESAVHGLLPWRRNGRRVPHDSSSVIRAGAGYGRRRGGSALPHPLA